MKTLSWLGIASVVVIAASCMPAVYNSRTPENTTTRDANDFNACTRVDERI